VTSQQIRQARNVQLDLNDVTASQLLLVMVEVDGQAVASFRLF
jgi:hypothetical protein